MEKERDLERFVAAQQRDYDTALAEVKRGSKRSHWMWYIFPQLRGLGLSGTSQFYGIHDLAEASGYLRHPILGSRLVAVCDALLQLDTGNATSIFGSPDDMKLRSSMTLFALVPGAPGVFGQVLHKFFHGVEDQRTLQLLGL